MKQYNINIPTVINDEESLVDFFNFSNPKNTILQGFFSPNYSYGSKSLCGEIEGKLPYDYIIEVKKDNEDNSEIRTHIISIPCAGYSKDRIKVQIKDSVLTVSFSKKPEDDEAKSENIKRVYVKKGMTSGSFQLTWAIKNIDKDSIKSCKLQDGILEISLQEHDPKKDYISIDID